jgi:Mn2+/Fe2+ NRAMP family transporter
MLKEKLKDLKEDRLLTPPPIWTLLGPAFIWASVAQGSGELIWWPYFAAKYGKALIGLIIPASIFQFFVNQEVARYTLLTGEGIWSGFKRVSRTYSIFLFLLAFVCFLWFGGYASAGGTALYSLTSFPPSVSERVGSLFWAYLTIIVSSLGLFFSKVVYQLIERFMKVVILVTFAGLLVTVFHPEVIGYWKDFMGAMLNPLAVRLPANWDPADTPNLVTAIAYAGMGGFLNLMYSYWLRDKGVGMAKYFGRVTSPITGKPEIIPATGYRFGNTPSNQSNWSKWVKYLRADNLLAVVLNTITLCLTTFLALAILNPRGEYPSGWKIAVIQARFFEVSFGAIGRSVFLVAAAFFFVDTWLGLADGIARQFADFTFSTFKSAQKRGFRFWYYLWLVWLILITSLTMPLAKPGTLINIAGVISIFAFALFIPLLWRLNFCMLPKVFPPFTRPKRITEIVLGITWLFYLAIALWFLTVSLSQ